MYILGPVPGCAAAATADRAPRHRHAIGTPDSRAGGGGGRQGATASPAPPRQCPRCCRRFRLVAARSRAKQDCDAQKTNTRACLGNAFPLSNLPVGLSGPWRTDSSCRASVRTMEVRLGGPRPARRTASRTAQLRRGGGTKRCSPGGP